MSRSRRWCFTLNNPTTYLQFDTSFQLYLIYAKEVGESGTMHFQGYMRCKNAVDLNRLKRWNSLAHFEQCKGTEQQNIEYVSKAPLEGPYEHGSRSEQGKRNDLLEIVEQVKEKKTIKSIAESYPVDYIKHHKGIISYKQATTKSALVDPSEFEVFYIYGNTGVGKTRLVYHQIDHEKMYVTSGNLEWWDGYDDHEYILIDEFTSRIPIDMVLRILDIYPMRLPVKGGFVNKNYKKVFITSNYAPTNVYSIISSVQQAAFMRRLTRVIHVDQPLDFSNLTIQLIPPTTVPTLVSHQSLLADENPLTPVDFSEDLNPVFNEDSYTQSVENAPELNIQHDEATDVDEGTQTQLLPSDLLKSPEKTSLLSPCLSPISLSQSASKRIKEVQQTHTQFDDDDLELFDIVRKRRFEIKKFINFDSPKK